MALAVMASVFAGSSLANPAPLAHASVAGPSPAAPQTEILFALDAKRGTYRPVRDRRGVYTLTLYGVKPRVVWFEDRPGERQGTTTVQRLLTAVASSKDAPNAALSAYVPRLSDQIIAGLKLLNGTYNAKQKILRYRVQELHRTAAAGLSITGTLPPRFTDSALFIDDLSLANPVTCTITLSFTGDVWPGLSLVEFDTSDTILQPPPQTSGLKTEPATWSTSGPAGCHSTATYIGDACGSEFSIHISSNSSKPSVFGDCYTQSGYPCDVSGGAGGSWFIRCDSPDIPPRASRQPPNI